MQYRSVKTPAVVMLYISFEGLHALFAFMLKCIYEAFTQQRVGMYVNYSSPSHSSYV